MTEAPELDTRSHYTGTARRRLYFAFIILQIFCCVLPIPFCQTSGFIPFLPVDSALEADTEVIPQLSSDKPNTDPLISADTQGTSSGLSSPTLLDTISAHSWQLFEDMPLGLGFLNL